MRIKSLLKNYFRKLWRRNLPSNYGGFASIVFTVRVEGESMWPALVPGRRYFASSIGVLRAGDFAVFRNPNEMGRIFVKKVTEVCGAAYRMESAVPWGSSSNDFGLVPQKHVLGKIWK